ncbi:hypothetical protein BJH93_11420 [Kocuria polaris]|nr:hypothetical protein [Kocuria polaris]
MNPTRRDIPSPFGADEPVSRRELNKAATRGAIVAAAVDMLRTHPDEPVTADRVAEAAGVSRRTFFNYFGSIEAALNAPMDDYLELAVANLGTITECTAAAEAAVRAIRDTTGAEALRPVAELFLLAQSNAQLARLQMESWNTCAERIMGILQEADADVPPLAAAAFAQAIVGAGRAAFMYWGQNLPPAAAGHSGAALALALAPESLGRLQATMIEALTQLRDGFPALQAPPA